MFLTFSETIHLIHNEIRCLGESIQVTSEKEIMATLVSSRIPMLYPTHRWPVGRHSVTCQGQMVADSVPQLLFRSLAVIFPLPSVLHFVPSLKARHVSTVREDYIHYTLVCANAGLSPPANILLGMWVWQKGWERQAFLLLSRNLHITSTLESKLPLTRTVRVGYRKGNCLSR